MKKLLLLTDFSNNARFATEYAIAMFGTSRVKYLLLHVVDDTASEVLISIEDILSQESQKRLQKEYAYFYQKYPSKNLDIEIRAECGETITVTHNTVKSEKVDLMVLGAQGVSSNGKGDIGSCAKKFVQQLQCPILVVPQ